MARVFDEITRSPVTRLSGDGDKTTSALATRPVWMMRQAGRYLPEYRAVRAKFPSFLEFCYTPDAATEVTLQPIDRFGFDAAIIFSDILVIPQALGQEVWFVTGEGPKLGPLPDLDTMAARLVDGTVTQFLSPVYQAIAQTRGALPLDVDLFGFAGAPWTLATYMLEGGSSTSYARALGYAQERPQDFARLLDIIERAVAQHLDAQAVAGANLLQIFDSWAGGIPSPAQRRTWSFAPLVRLGTELAPLAPSMLFAKGCALELADYMRGHAEIAPGRLGLAVGQDQSVAACRAALGDLQVATQGNLDPTLMSGEWAPLKAATQSLLATLAPEHAHVMNLGHGIRPEGHADNVARWVALIKETPR